MVTLIWYYDNLQDPTKVPEFVGALWPNLFLTGFDSLRGWRTKRGLRGIKERVSHEPRLSQGQRGDGWFVWTPKVGELQGHFLCVE